MSFQSNLTFGVIREEKTPVDWRAPLIPDQILNIKSQFPLSNIVVQSSGVRCYCDDDYRKSGVQVVEALDSCDVLLGVKEVPVENLVSGKTYFFFSHTIKAQPYNKALLQTILKKNITLIDYEVLKSKAGHRIVAFGRYAGIVGAYNAIMTYGHRYNLFDLRRAYECFDLADMKTEYNKVTLPPVRIAITGSGRVAHGAMEVLDSMGLKKVETEEFLQKSYDAPVYTQLDSSKYNAKSDGSQFNHDEFHRHPGKFKNNFSEFTRCTDILIAGAYWDPAAPVLFTREDIGNEDFSIKIIADITCDIEGSIPSTIRPTTIENPIYDYDAQSHNEVAPFSSEKNITVMAVDNLPCELPRDSSWDFGEQLINEVFPAFFNDDTDGILQDATIATNGNLTERFNYLASYIATEDTSGS